MNDMKYIQLDTIQAGASFFLFPSWFDHAELARRIAPHADVLSAGFVSFASGKPTCHGNSTSLKIGVGENDTKWLRRQLRIED